MTPPLEVIERLVHDWADDRQLMESTDTKTQALKFFEEAGELAGAILRDDREKMIDGVGDVLVTLTNVTRKAELGRLADCFWAAYKEIKDRKGKTVNGNFVKEGE